MSTKKERNQVKIDETRENLAKIYADKEAYTVPIPPEVELSRNEIFKNLPSAIVAHQQFEDFRAPKFKPNGDLEYAYLLAAIDDYRFLIMIQHFVDNAVKHLYKEIDLSIVTCEFFSII